MTDVLKNFLFIDQLKVMGYGESDTSGCWIKFQITPELLEVVRGRKGEMVEVSARLIDNSGEYIPPAQEEPSNGKFWHDLIKNGVFNAPPVLEAIGTDKMFLEWIRHQPSCLSGDMDWDAGRGEGRCEPAHVRRVSEGAGTAIKPAYFAVPLTHGEHLIQHNSGEQVALKVLTDEVYSNLAAKEWFEKQAAYYRTKWASKTLAQHLGYDSRKDCPPAKVLAWAESNGLLRYFPSKLRDAA